MCSLETNIMCQLYFNKKVQKVKENEMAVHTHTHSLPNQHIYCDLVSQKSVHFNTRKGVRKEGKGRKREEERIGERRERSREEEKRRGQLLPLDKCTFMEN